MAALKTTQLNQLKAQLKTQYQTLLRDIREELNDAGAQHPIDLLNHEPGDSGDESMANELAEINVATLDHHVRDVRDIEDAFKRFKEDSYGVCVDCGEDIAYERLSAYPTAKRCIVCQERHEQRLAQEAHPSR
ncbi:MAG: TraR/DksA C4-type zinc finger protein [Thiobacillus sp.]|nr:TraR/DksA C4-type zinc finger protein [Thiobacillus sp.]